MNLYVGDIAGLTLEEAMEIYAEFRIEFIIRDGKLKGFTR